jgi:phosphoribosylglycinamide formyltransferase-1
MFIGVLVSGGGTNLQKIIDATQTGYIPAQVACVISSRRDAYALERAKNAGIDALTILRKDFAAPEDYEAALVSEFRRRGVSLVLLAGFMTALGETFLSAFPGAVMNVHPSLIPSFCGAGYYGLRVHKAALAAGVKVTGATVHFVTAEIDGGPIIAQKAVDVLDGAAPETLQRRVMEQAEWVIYPEAVRKYCEEKIKEEDNKDEKR